MTELRNGSNNILADGSPRSPSTSVNPVKSTIFAWTLFDFANTAFSVMIVTVGYALYFRTVVAGGTNEGDFYWGMSVSLSMLIAMVISPVLGAAADFSRRKKRFLFAFTITSIICTALLFFIQEGMVFWGMLFFIIGNIGFEGGLVFYDAFLPEITSEHTYGRVSGYGFAMGYLGALFVLAIAFPLLKDGFVAENLVNVRISFLVAAAFFLVFSIPTFLVLRDQKVQFQEKVSYLRVGLKRSLDTLRHLRNYRDIARFLIAFLIYNDAILTVIAFASIYAGKTLNFSFVEIVIFFIIVQSTAILGSIVFGIITDHIGPKKTITITLLIWIVVVVGAFFATSKLAFYVVGLLAGASIGSSQSSSRSLMAHLTPKNREAEFFGFFDGLCGKASAVVGPFLFGLISAATGSQRIAVVSVGFFFVLGLILLQRVDVQKRYTTASDL
jgi:UMF1 family MFS transporter